MYWDQGHDGNQALVMTVLMIGGWLLIIAVLYLLARALLREFRGAPRHPSRPTPLQQLDERLARGDIEAEEYSRRRELLLTSHADDRA